MMPGGGGGGNICEENLEQRIERIRKRDEEIEKRHREAEADRLAALQANAMVKTTAPADDDWPKAHKYDKLDFTYDVKSDNTETDAEKKTPTTEDSRHQQRPLKKFWTAPPADPSYNFLADAERDGKPQANNVTSNETKNWRANNSNNKNGDASSNRRNNTNNSSFNRGRNGAKAKNPSQKGRPADEPILRRNDRERQPQASDGMWRRNDDKKVAADAKATAVSATTSPTHKKTADDRQAANYNSKGDGKTGTLDSPTKQSNKTSIQQRMNYTQQQQQQQPNAELQQKLSDLSIEKRGNITVSVTKDGEVKSVKLEASRAIGTGRVGGGTTLRHNIQVAPPQAQQPQLPQPQQQQQMMDANLNISATPALFNYPVIDQFKPQQTTQVQQTEAPVETAMITTPKPMSNIVNGVPFKLPSVQDRLIKNRVFFDETLRNVAEGN